MGEPLISAVFDLDITATTSIVHRDDTRNNSSIQSLFRREKILTPTGEVAVVPIISGNAWRGILRRTGETLLAEVLDYDGQLTPAAVSRSRATRARPAWVGDLKGRFGGSSGSCQSTGVRTNTGMTRSVFAW